MNNKKMLIVGGVAVAGVAAYMYMNKSKAVIPSASVVVDDVERIATVHAFKASLYTSGAYGSASFEMAVTALKDSPNNSLTDLEAREKVVAGFYKK